MNNGSAISNLLGNEFGGNNNIMAGVLLHPELTIEEAVRLYKTAKGKPTALIHSGFMHVNRLVEELEKLDAVSTHVFIGDSCGKLYQRKFKADGGKRVLIRDGFESRPNRNHPNSEFFLIFTSLTLMKE